MIADDGLPTDMRQLWLMVVQERGQIVRQGGHIGVKLVAEALRGRQSKWLRHFASHQQDRRSWIRCASLADWCARQHRSIEVDRRQYYEACRQIMFSLFDGEFVVARHRPHLLTGAGGSRMSLERLHPLVQWWLSARVGDNFLAPDHLRVHLDRTIRPLQGWDIETATELGWFMEHIWISREFARQWCEARNLDVPPWLPRLPGASRSAHTSVDLVSEQAPPFLQMASERTIHIVIEAVYDHAQQHGMKPPNLREIGKQVAKILARQGLAASERRIAEFADSPQHKMRRGKVGSRVGGRLRPFSLEGIAKTGCEG